MGHETISSLPKWSPERNAVARQLLDARRLDRKRAATYTNDRDIWDYDMTLLGLKHFFQYIHELSDSARVLDIGTGEGYAADDLKKRYAKHLPLTITGLTAPFQLLTPDIQVLHTSAEVLCGVKDTSISGAIACHSLSYSSQPELAIRRLDEVLIPGGAIKTKFASRQEEYTGEIKPQTSERFDNELRRLGYDTAVRGE
jgi:ubiquinone/menaquinone biosynthesis C-methylase UbiE